ncbi:MAG: methyltransferase domain-containing protein [Chloroflexia bacterium]
MPHPATVHRILISSPGDMVHIRERAKEVILRWNATHSLRRSIVFQPVMWELDTIPEFGNRPQAIINRQIVDSSDMLLGMFWTRLGTPTGQDLSGTVEEINVFRRAKKPIMLYFSEEAIPPDRIDSGQYQSLQAFKADCRRDGLYVSFSSLDDFDTRFSHHLDLKAYEYAPVSHTTPFLSHSRKTTPSDSFYNLQRDRARLQIQVKNFIQTERKAIDLAIEYIRQNLRPSVLSIVDVGCADGYGTKLRFGRLQGIKVLAIDKDETAIKLAQDHANAPNIEYRVLDICHGLPQNSSVHLVLCSEVLHHLANPDDAMRNIWSRIEPGGALIVRASDDGTKITYPSNADLDFLLQTTNTMLGSSDRQYGRKVYPSLKALSPSPKRVSMFFQVDTTAGRSQDDRVDFFEDNYSYREFYAEEMLRQAGGLTVDKTLRDHIRHIVEAQREMFRQNDALFSMNVQNIGIAFKAL